MIRLEHVTYFYPNSKHPALNDVTLEIEDNAFVAMMGASGAGKSTLCAAIAGFVPHHFRGDLRGRVTVNGREVPKTPLAEMVTAVGLVFQNPFNQMSGAKLTVRDEVAFGLENLGVAREEMIARVTAMLALVGLSDLAERSPYSLSGGEMQRVALASILVMEPRVLVLDEPTAQLDPIGTKQMFAAIRALVATRGITVMLVEHKTEWIAEFADRVIVLRDGTVARDGKPRAVLTSAQMPELGIAATRYTEAARAAQPAGWGAWSQNLPVTLNEAVAGFESLRGGV